jgi:hypothetical protein
MYYIPVDYLYALCTGAVVYCCRSALVYFYALCTSRSFMSSFFGERCVTSRALITGGTRALSWVSTQVTSVYLSDECVLE